MSLECFDKNAGTDAVVAGLNRDGAAILWEQASHETVDAVAAELRPYFDAEGDRFQSDFNGYETRRISAILARSRTSAELIGDRRLLGILDAILLPHCINYRIGSTTGIEILPGEDAQELHRDDSIYPVRIPGVQLQVNAMWALNDFSVENGATRIVPGSHRWMEPDRIPTEDDVVQQAMPKGSVLIYLSSVQHGGGANRSNQPRMGLINTYSLGWLRQEVNQYLTIPREVADSYPEPIRRLIGYQSHGLFLGKYPEDPDGGWFLD